jgi:FAD:protein FMN transferase
VDDQRVTHILDPRTGSPLTHRLASVTIIDTLAVRADAFDTALMVLGMDEGLAFGEKAGPRCPVHRAHRCGIH